MSYCRWLEGDVYAYPSVSGYYECCDCLLSVGTVFLRTAAELDAHFEMHLAAGHRLPERARSELRAEAKMRDAELAAVRAKRNPIGPDSPTWIGPEGYLKLPAPQLSPETLAKFRTAWAGVDLADGTDRYAVLVFCPHGTYLPGACPDPECAARTEKLREQIAGGALRPKDPP